MRHRLFASSPSFSGNEQIRERLSKLPIDLWLNATNRRLDGQSLVDEFNGFKGTLLIVGLEPLGEDEILKMKSLKFVSKYGVGKDNVDTECLERQGIGFGWTPGVNKRSVAELVLSFALSHQRNVYRSTFELRAGQWKKDGGRQLSNSTFGILGFGNVGREIAAMLKGFGCRILACDTLDKSVEAEKLGVEMVGFDQLISNADVLSINVPSTLETRSLLNSRSLQQLKQGCQLINTSRGDVVDFDWAVSAVRAGALSGYCSDVFPTEPCDLRHFLEDPRFQFTPHIGGNAREAVLAMGHAAIDHVENYLLKELNS